MTFFSHRRLLMTFLLIICCVFAPLLLSPLSRSSRNSPLHTYTWQSTTLEKFEVAEQHSSVLCLTLTTVVRSATGCVVDVLGSLSTTCRTHDDETRHNDSSVHISHFRHCQQQCYLQQVVDDKECSTLFIVLEEQVYPCRIIPELRHCQHVTVFCLLGGSATLL